MTLPAAVQRRVDDEAGAWAQAFPDPDVADPALRAAAHRFADATAPMLLGAAPAPRDASRMLAVVALVLATLAVLGLVLPLAAVPLLVAAAVLCLGVAWGGAAAAPAPPPLEELRAALGAAASRGVLARRTAARTGGQRGADGVPEAAPWAGSGAVTLPPAQRGRATYEAAAHLADRDTSRVIEL